MLYLIGLGINKENITFGALEAAKKCDELYLESYTSLGLSKNELEKLLGKKIREVDRDFVENYDVIDAKDRNIGILVYGDIFSATTHVSLLLDCKKNNIDYKLLKQGMKDKLCVGIERLGFSDERIVVKNAKELANVKFSKYPQCLIVVGKMHFVEEEVLGLWNSQ